MRHAMEYYIDYARPNVREGFEPLWRKWPIDIVSQTYELDEGDEEALVRGAPVLSADELYNAPVKTDALGSLGLERPLTWRGGLYVVERVLDKLEPKGFKAEFVRRATAIDEV